MATFWMPDELPNMRVRTAKQSSYELKQLQLSPTFFWKIRIAESLVKLTSKFIQNNTLKTNEDPYNWLSQ
jgi:hypothetical protein